MREELYSSPLVLRPTEYPALFAELRRAGWDEGRKVAGPTPDGIPLLQHDYAADFLATFFGLTVSVVGSVIPKVRLSFSVGFGDPLSQMHLPDTFSYVQELAGTPWVYPVLGSGSYVGFVLDDGRALLVDVTFEGCASALDPFQMMDWLLFRKARPGFEMRRLDASQRPHEFR